jgi:hypothetical protein
MLFSFIRLLNAGSGRGWSLVTNSFPAVPAIEEDPEFSGRSPEEARRLRHDRELRKREEQADTDTRKAERDGRVFWAATDMAARDAARLAVSIIELRAAVSRAYELAIEREDEARKDVDAAKEGAILLKDGRRVYFSADGNSLHDEEGRVISDKDLIRDARGKRTGSSTSIEELKRRQEDLRKAVLERTKLQEALDEMDRIETALGDKELSPQRRKDLEQELERIVEALPDDVKTDYAEIQKARKSGALPAYSSAAAEYDVGPLLRTDFEKAVKALASVEAGPSSPEKPRTLAYRDAPDF